MCSHRFLMWSPGHCRQPLSNEPVLRPSGQPAAVSKSLDFMARLAALVPRPRAHLVRYHGVFAPNAKHRHHIVTRPASMPVPDNPHDGEECETREPRPTAPMSWMQRLRRVFDIDLQSCPKCGATVRVIAVSTAPAHPCARGFSASLHVTEPALIARILDHRDGRDDFRAQAATRSARAPPATSLH